MLVLDDERCEAIDEVAQPNGLCHTFLIGPLFHQ